MAGVDHPLFGSHYEPEADGTVRVTEQDGRTGWFTWRGRHVRGDVRWADPHVLDWVGGPQAERNHQRLRAAEHRAVDDGSTVARAAGEAEEA